MSFKDLSTEFVLPFFDPAQRVFWLTLVCTPLVGFLLLFGQGDLNAWSKVRTQLLNKNLWLSPSSKLDFKIFFINQLLRTFALLALGTVAYYSHSASVLILKGGRQLFGEISPILKDPHLLALIYTVFSFLLLDFLRFYQHYLMHRIGWLWRFHKVHHSASVLTPLTLYRVHPVEIALSTARTLLATALSSALFVFLFQVPVTGYHILGVNIFGYVFNFVGSNLRHSHLWISYGQWEKLLVSPAQHQMHHSQNPKLHNSNYGICLSIWDRLFGSLRTSSEVSSPLSFGLKENPHRTVSEVYIRPFSS